MGGKSEIQLELLVRSWGPWETPVPWVKPCPKHLPTIPFRDPRLILGALGGADPAVGM